MSGSIDPGSIILVTAMHTMVPVSPVIAAINMGLSRDMPMTKGAPMCVAAKNIVHSGGERRCDLCLIIPPRPASWVICREELRPNKTVGCSSSVLLATTLRLTLLLLAVLAVLPENERSKIVEVELVALVQVPSVESMFAEIVVVKAVVLGVLWSLNADIG